MDITAIAAALESIKALSGLAKVATSAAVDHELKGRLIDIQSGILDAQGKLGDAQAERLELLQQVAELKEKIRGFEAIKAALDAYELHEIEAGKFLYKARAAAGHPVDHFACPTCHNAGKVTVLQSQTTPGKQTLYTCATCKFVLYVGPRDQRLLSQRLAGN